MPEVALRELRNNTAGVLRRAQAGEQVLITARGKPVASLNPIEPRRRRWLSRTELVRRLGAIHAEPDLCDDLARLAAGATEDLAQPPEPAPSRGLLDASVFVAGETDRPVDVGALPQEAAVSLVTVAELQARVLAAEELDVRARRLVALESIADMEPIPLDEAVVRSWALLRVHLANKGPLLSSNDLWIAATALAHGLSLVVRDDRLGPLDGAAGLHAVRV
jgi:prevent-host-death family protein